MKILLGSSNQQALVNIAYTSTYIYWVRFCFQSFYTIFIHIYTRTQIVNERKGHALLFFLLCMQYRFLFPFSSFVVVVEKANKSTTFTPLFFSRSSLLFFSICTHNRQNTGILYQDCKHFT